jgi:putative transposase
VPNAEGWPYIAVVLDAYSKRILGWAFYTSLETEFVVAALLMAIARRRGRRPKGLLFHSDRGVQYISARFRTQLAAHNLAASMNRRDNCHDDAAMEAFWSSLKNELVHSRRFVTRADARTAIFDYIESFYNRSRRFSSFGYQSSLDYESSLSQEGFLRTQLVCVNPGQPHPIQLKAAKKQKNPLTPMGE